MASYRFTLDIKVDTADGVKLFAVDQVIGASEVLAGSLDSLIRCGQVVPVEDQPQPAPVESEPQPAKKKK
jgi:hypothetical protein